MATITTKNELSYVEIVKREVGGQTLKIAEIGEKQNKILEDMPFYEANERTSEKIGTRSSYPHGRRKRLYRGDSKGATQIKPGVETITKMQTRSVIDIDAVDNAANPKQQRWIEDKGFIEGLYRDQAVDFAYGSIAAEPEAINGFITRFDDLSLDNVKDGGASAGDVSSILTIEFGRDTVYGIYPKSHPKKGIDKKDMSIKDEYDENGDPFEAYVTKYSAAYGLVVKDPSAVQRICNVPLVVDYTLTNDIGVNPRILIDALGDTPSGGDGYVVIYAPRKIYTQIQILAYEKKNGFYMLPDIFGRMVSTFMGVPVKRWDSLDVETILT